MFDSAPSLPAIAAKLERQAAQGELFTRVTLPRQLPVLKACPEDEALPPWAHALRAEDTQH